MICRYCNYNLDDGEPEHTGILLNSSGASSLAKVSPFATIVTTSIEKEQLVFSITLTDADIVLLSQATAALYVDDVLFGSSQLLNAGVNTITFAGIQSNTTYTLKIEADYNLDDGNADIHQRTLWFAGNGRPGVS